MRFVAEFPCYNADIETYVRKEKAREHPDGEFHLILGLRFLLWDIFGFIDCSIEQIAVPFSGPQEEYEGTARWPKYKDAHQAFLPGTASTTVLKLSRFLHQLVSAIFFDLCLPDPQMHLCCGPAT